MLYSLNLIPGSIAAVYLFFWGGNDSPQWLENGPEQITPGWQKVKVRTSFWYFLLQVAVWTDREGFSFWRENFSEILRISSKRNFEFFLLLLLLQCLFLVNLLFLHISCFIVLYWFGRCSCLTPKWSTVDLSASHLIYQKKLD